ncbi:MAG: acetyl-CoA carboxylase biotin carboxyl carrier protein [Saprospiraceae bacterium]|jgi:acetyl-CoA carboxylase biotin carboxyl carrier protein
MTFKDIQDLIKLINRSDLSEFRMKDGDFELTVRTNEYMKNRGTTTTQIMPMHAPAMQAAAPAQALAPIAAPAPVAAPEAAEEDTSKYLEIKSPMVGTFYRSPSPDKPIYVKVGDSVSEGSPVCIIEAMKLFNEIESEVTGKIVKVLVEDAQPVEYDQVLFLVDPS